MFIFGFSTDFSKHVSFLCLNWEGDWPSKLFLFKTVSIYISFSEFIAKRS